MCKSKHSVSWLLTGKKANDKYLELKIIFEIACNDTQLNKCRSVRTLFSVCVFISACSIVCGFKAGHVVHMVAGWAIRVHLVRLFIKYFILHLYFKFQSPNLATKILALYDIEIFWSSKYILIFFSRLHFFTW